jgi:hypothetical protein
MLLKKNKLAQNSAPVRLFLIIVGLILFFAMYPVLSSIIDAIGGGQTDPIVAFMIYAVPYVVLIGLMAWILRGDV